jgi:exodeoxyribonuclease VII large subunit
VPNTYLTTQYKEKDKVKALGAQFDSERRAWYVPEGLDLAPFTAWLPAKQAAAPLVPSAREEDDAGGAWAVAPVDQQAGAVATQKRGVTLSQLMLGVTQAVARAYPSAVWTMVEVIKADARSGNVYLELAERVEGRVVAQARGTIWASEARRIIPEFQRATGVVLGAGIKLLVRAKPAAHAIYGLSVAIDAIDPDYTLGDLEAKKREIRTRLQREGLFGLNKQLPAPWDFNSVVVVAPQGAAGLGDFQAEAHRLARYGVCEFVYAHSRFQGEGAAEEIRLVLLETVDRFERERGVLPDAVAIIRGGGAVNDLAWLDDYTLARCICEMRVPVLTGIGHERDNTILDEVAHTRFDTPSKVIGGIEHLVLRRAQEAKASFRQVVELAARAVQTTTKAVDGLDANVRSGSMRQVASARQQTAAMLSEVRLGAMQVVRRGSEAARESMFSIRAGASDAIGLAKREAPAMLGEITAAAGRSVVTVKADARQRFGFIVERARSDAKRAGDAVGRELSDVRSGAARTVVDAKERSEAMMREIAGQGPSKTLGRGFAVLRGENGATITSARATAVGVSVRIELRDGTVEAVAKGVLTKDD